MRKLFLFIISSFFVQLNAQNFDSVSKIALQNGTEILEIEKNILNQSYEVKKQLSKLKDYSQNYKDGTLVCSLPQEDYIIYEQNLNILNNIYDNLFPSLIKVSKEYLESYLNLSNDDIIELNRLYLTENKLPNFPLIHFSGSQAPENSNLKKIDTNIYGVSPVYRVTHTDVLPIYLPNIDNEILPVLALASVELRLNNPDRFFSDEFPNLNNPIPGYNYQTNDIGWGDIAFCAAVAIGADFLWGTAGLSGNQGNKWTKKAIVKAFGKIASRMLGPVGTVIAVGTFAGCLIEAGMSD